MNRIFSLVILLVSACSLAGQITVTNAYFPAAGDSLRIATDTSSAGITISPPGGNQSWDFTALSLAFTRTIAFRPAAEGQHAASFPGATLVAPAGGNGENYYRVTPTTYELIGFAGGDPLGFGINVNTPFNPASLERRAPVNFFDVNPTNAALLVPFDADDLPAALLALLPITPDSIRLRVAISRVDAVDGWGTLAIPGGSYTVLRERRTQYSDTRIDIKIGPFPWSDITALIPLPGAGLGRDTSLTYNFFSNAAKEPIAVVEVDHVTQSVLSVQYKLNAIVAGAGDIASSRPAVMVYPNPASDFARVEFVEVPSGTYHFTLYNVAGQMALQQQFYHTGHATEEIKLQGLSSGAHVYIVSDQAGNMIATGRLVLASPR